MKTYKVDRGFVFDEDGNEPRNGAKVVEVDEARRALLNELRESRDSTGMVRIGWLALEALVISVLPGGEA